MNNIKKPRLKKNLDKGYLNEIKGSDIICDLSFSDEKSLNDIKDIEFNGCLFKNIDFSDCRLKNIDLLIVHLNLAIYLIWIYVKSLFLDVSL